jgi:hypothetical protein
VGEIRNSHKVLIGNLKGRDLSGDLDIDGRIIIKWILK